MSERSVEYLLIGGGIASANCARTLRDRGAEGEVLIVGREPDPPYDRPPLSKKYVTGEESREDIVFRPPEWYEQNDIEVVTMTSVMKLDLGERTATLSSKERLRFGKALVATGANVRVLRVEGAQLDGIHYLRTMRNADALRNELAEAERVVLVGGSYIGCELAASFTTLGKRCELVMLENVTLERHFGAEVGWFFQRLLRDHGVRVHGSQELERFEGTDDRVRKVVTKAGLELECDFVAIGAGVQPDLRLAQQAGLDTERGVLTDEFLRTSAPDVYAAGDVAEYDSVLHDRRLQIEHWDTAFTQGRAAALGMLGGRQPYDVVPYFWSDLADWAKMEYVGPAGIWDEIWWRGSIDDGRFTAWYVNGGRLAAALTVGRAEDLAVARALLARRADVSPHRSLIEDSESDLSVLIGY
jgi:3-phenylpropionate/trans-cinnamate dioxygenase ferredoxin reductase subunit